MQIASSQGHLQLFSNQFRSTVHSNPAGQSNSNMSSPLNASALLDNTAVRENLLAFVENFESNPSHDTPNTPAPTIIEMAPLNPVRSRLLVRFNRLQTLRSQSRMTSQGPPRTPLQSIASFIEKCQRRRISNRACQLSDTEGVCSIKTKPFISQDKKGIVGLPSLFDVGLMAELTDEDEFLGPMKRAILDNDVQTFSKQGLYIAQFWPVASVVDSCILIDYKLAIPFKLRSAILTRLRQSHPGQQAMIEAAEYIWWPYLNRQIVEGVRCSWNVQNLVRKRSRLKHLILRSRFHPSLLLMRSYN